MKTYRELVSDAKQLVPEVSVEEMRTRLAAGDPVTVIDVRDPDEYREGFIEGAVSISRGFLEFKVQDAFPDPETPIVLYCLSGLRSLLAARALQELGYRNVASMAGGIRRWKELRLSLVKEQPLTPEQMERYSRHFMLAQVGPDAVHVDEAGRFVHTVLRRLEDLAADVDRGAVREVAAVRQLHPQDAVARLEHREIRREVGLRAGVGLDVGVRRAEQVAGPLDGKPLDLVHYFAAAVIPLAGIPLGVLVGQLGAHRLEHRAGREVLTGNELEPDFLPLDLAPDERGNLRIHFVEGVPAHRHLRSGPGGPAPARPP